MLMMIFRLLMPIVGRYLANYAADYLENRRAARRVLQEQSQRPVECPPCPPAEASASGSANAIWFSLSGLLLGGALSTILYVFWRDVNREPEFEP